ncbi:MAG: glycosyltransferase family 1 protein [Candidatus Uhrbacteria bacterium]
MKIGIDARMYGPKVGGGGLGRYVEQLITELQSTDQKNHYVLFLKKENFEACRITNPNFEKRLADVHWYTFDEQRILPKIIDREKLDLIHFPHWNIPLLLRTPFVVTIHDLILLDDPSSAKATSLGSIAYAIKRLGYKAVLQKAISRSQKIITVSKATEFSILKHFPKVDAKKIQVVYEGVVGLDRGERGKGKGKENFILYIGNSYPHKNLQTLLEAFQIFRQIEPEAKLVMAGHQDLFSDRIEAFAKTLNFPTDAVKFIRDPEDKIIADLYSNAKIYVFPSKLEGFGLPGLEAMSMGVPVIAARAGSLPEILGDAAVYFDPNRVDDLTQTIQNLWNNDSQQNELTTKGFQQVKKYSWQKMAGEIKEVYLGVTLREASGSSKGH